MYREPAPRTRWLLDANIIIYCLGRDQILSNPRVAHLRERLDTLDRVLEEAIASGHRLLVTPVVIAETLYVLEGAYHFTPAQAASALVQFVRAPAVEVEHEEAVLTGLRHYATGWLSGCPGNGGWRLPVDQ